MADDNKDVHQLIIEHALPSLDPSQAHRMFIHYASRQAQDIDLAKQPWMRLRWSRNRAIRYLRPAPKGAFVVRRSQNKGEFVLSVQAGPRVCHIRLMAVQHNGHLIYNVYPTPQWFESLYDLVLFSAHQPFSFEHVPGAENITLNLASAEKAENINRLLQLRNAVGRSFRIKTTGPKKPAAEASKGLSLASVPVLEVDDEDESDDIVFAGFLTKQGQVRKTWKRRFFELTTNGMLTYYKVSGKRHELGKLNMSKCQRVMLPSTCPISWYPNANPCLCLGLAFPQRHLYFFADSRDEMQAWLQAFASVVPEGVTVPSLAQLASSRQVSVSLPAKMQRPKRLTVFRNGICEQGKVVVLPVGSMDDVLASLSEQLGVPEVKGSGRLFSEAGGEFTDVRLLRDNDVVFVSSGEEFVGVVV